MPKHTMVIEADSVAELRQRIADTHAALSGNAPAVAPAAKEVAKSAPKAAAKAAPKKEEEAPPAEETVEPETDIFGGDGEAAPPTKVYTLAEIQASLKKVVDGKGLPAAKAVLNKLGVAKASDTATEKYPDFVAACEAALK